MKFQIGDQLNDDFEDVDRMTALAISSLQRADDGEHVVGFGNDFRGAARSASNSA
jgi:hypothetical protein